MLVDAMIVAVEGSLVCIALAVVAIVVAATGNSVATVVLWFSNSCSY